MLFSECPRQSRPSGELLWPAESTWGPVGQSICQGVCRECHVTEAARIGSASPCQRQFKSEEATLP